MNEKYQEFYDYLKSQNLTDLDAESFQIAYSEPEKFNELWGYISEQNLTDLTRDEFFDSYFSDVKKKDTASVSEPGSLVSPELEVPVETAIAPTTEAAEPATTLTGAADPDFFEERMEMISPQLIDRGDEDEVAQELTDVFKPYGFEVEPAGIGDAIKVTAGNGKSIEVDLDPFEMPKILSPFGLDFNTETETAEAKKLQDFLRENRQEGLDAPRRFVTNKQRDDEVKRINQKQKEINRSAQDYLKRTLEFQNKYPQFLTYDPEYIKNNPEEYQRFLNDRDSLEGEREFLGQTHQKAKEEGAQLDRLAGEYTEMLAQRGYWSGGVFRNEFIQGVADIAAGANDFLLDIAYDPKFLWETDPEFFKDNYLKEAADKGYDVPSASDMTVDEFKAWMKTDKGIPAKESIAIQTSIVDTKLKRRKRGEPIDYEEALNAYSQYATSKNMEVTDGELAALRKSLDFLKDPESTPEAADLMYESFWGGALLGVTRSLPAILVPGGFITRTAAMYSQISSALEQEMAKDPDFQNISEAERFRLKLAIGSVSSVLESLGVRNVLKQKGLLTGILMKALKKTPANVKGKAFNEVVMREVNSAIGRGALVITGAGLAEFETGFLQEGVDISFKNIYNEMKDKEMFETPETWSSETLNRMLYAGAQEAVGGFVLGTPGAISAARGTYDFTAVDDATFEMFENVSSQTARGELTYRHMFYTNLQAKINQGKISKEDAQQEMDNLDEVIAVNRDIPSDLTVSQKKKALGILLRKKDLQEQIEGKDPILVKRQQEELNSLNGELDQILYGTPETDAIQEPSPETVDAPELTPSSEAVGEGVPDIGEPTTEVEAEDQVAEAPPTAEVAVEETVSEPTQEVTEEEQVDIDEFFGEQDIEGVEKVSENLVINRKQKAPTADPKSQRRMNRVRQMSVKAAASIRKIAPEVKILIHESPEEYQRFAGEQTAGNYDPKTKTIHINLGKANLYTAPHEVFHALLLQNISTDSEALTVSRKMLESVRKVVDPNSQMAKDIDEFVARYGDAPTIQDEEYLAQLTGILTAEYRTLNKPAKNAVKDFLRKLAKMLGLEKYLGPEFLKTDEQVIDLLNTISRRMSEGEYIEAADVQAMGDILSEATPAEQAQAQSEVEEFNRKERERKAAEEKGIMARQQIVGERASLEDDVRDGLVMAVWTYIEQGDSKKVRREVKAAWGWEKGADGKWRYEIETGELKKVPNGTYKLSDVYDAPELYKAYPEAKDISLTINVRDAGAENSWFMPDENAVEINVKNYGRVRPDLIHELQHYVQFKEGFAIGGNTGSAIELINSLSPDKLEEINKLNGKEAAMTILNEIAEEADIESNLTGEELIAFYVDDLKSMDTIEEYLAYNTKQAKTLKSLYGEDAADYVLQVLEEDFNDLEGVEDLMGGLYPAIQEIQEQTEIWSPYAVYERLIGEVEARNAASRDGGGRSLIEDSEDTPRADQLAVFDEQEKVLRKIEAKEEMTEQELDALDLAKLPAQEGSNKGAGLFYGPRATIANYESAKTMFADGVPAEDIEMLTGWNVVEKQNGDVVYVLSRNEVESKDTIDKAIASRKDRGVSPRMQVEGINPKDVRMRSRSGNRVGKGLSVKKVNNEAVVEEIPDLTLDYVRENAPASYLKNANLIAQYPLVRGVKNFDEVSSLEQADEVYEVYARQVADNLNWIMESYPEEYREISTLWYDGANKIANELAADYGVSPEQVAGIIASLSPQNDWYQNVRAAELLLLAFRENPVMSQKMIDYQVNYAEGKINDLKKRIKSARKAKGKSQAKAKVEKFKAAEVKNLKAIADAEALLDLLRSYKGKRMEDAPDALKPYYVRLYNEVNQPKSYPIISPDGNYGSDALTDAGGKRKFGWGSYTEIGKGVSIRLDGSQENISVTLGQMHKIRNFFNNIIDPMSKEKDITMDTHAIAAALLIPASSKTKEVVQNFGTGTANSGVKGQKGLYYANQAGYFLSAEENNMLPRQVQSVTWEAVRGLFTSKFKDGAKNVKSINDIWENYAEGNITIEQARQEVLEKADGINAPSWAGLISDESRDGDGTTTERGRGQRGGPVAEREGVAPRQQVADVDKKIDALKAKQTKASEAEYKRDKAGKPAYSKAFFAEDDKFRKEIKRLKLLKLGLAPAYEQRVKISEELDELNKPFEREVGNKYYPRLGTVSKGEMTGEDSDLGGIYEAEVDGYLFRGVSVEDYNRIKKEGFIDTDLRGAISDKEGINLTPYSATAFNYLPEGVEGVVMAMKVSDKSGLFMIGADDYVRSSKPIPFTDVEFVTTPVIEGRYLSVKDGKSTPIAIKKVSHPSKKTEPDVAPRQQVVYHITVRDNKGNIQKKGLEKDRPPTFAKGVMGTAVFDTAGKSFAFSNLEDATKWGIKTKIEKDKEVSIVAINAEGKTLQEDKAVTEDPFNPLSSAVFTEDVISPSDILSIEDVDYKFGKPFDKSGEPLTEESFDIEEGITPRQQVIEDVTAKELDTPLDRQQRVFRSGDLENKAEPRWKFRSSRETGHFGTGFYFFGTKEQADEYDARDVSEIDIDKYNLAKATKKLHDALKDINTQYNEYYEVEAINELKKEPLRQAVPTFFIEEVAKAAGMGVISEAELEAAATEVTKALTKDGNPAFGDSVSTLVMKALGFEGVNAVGTRMDNSTYGTVIYDIKSDAAPRQQLSDIATPLPRQQKSVREVVQQARDNNFKDAATKDFLKRKGVPTADIDKAIKTLDDVYARVMKEIDGVITKSQKRGVDFDTQLKNALAYLQGTKLYEDTTDIHREKLIREVRAKFDKKEKRAPSAKRILGDIKDVKTVTLKEKEALKMQLRLVAKTAKTTARALVVAGSELTKSLKEMVKGGVITANQMSSVLRRFSRVDLFNPASIDSFLDYMAKIFADAEYGAKIARIKKLLPRAKKNIKSKIGVADVLGDTLTKLFNVNPTLIPMEMLEDYQNLLEMMGAAKKVLPLADINDVTEMANKLLNAVYEEVSMAEDLAEVFANYENKVIKDGKVDYAATVRAMIADETISEAEATVMIKYKSRIVESTKKEPKTEEELAEERAELMSSVEAAKVNVSRLVMDEERTLARQLAKLMRTEAIERLSNQQLETLLAVIDNINNGFVTHAANRLYVNMNASNRAELFASATQESKPLTVSKFIARVKAGITQNNKFFEAIKRRPLVYIDQLFGNHNTTRIYDSIFKPLAKASDSMNVEIQRIEERLDKAENAISKSFKRNPNKSRMSSYKRMTYMLQREFESNPDNGQVNPAADFIRATIDHIKKGKSFFKGRDAEMLQQILDDFGVSIKDADGNDVIQIDSQKLYDSFNKAERNALAVAEDINKSLASKAVFTAAVIRGKRVNALNQYAHHNVLSSSEQIDNSTSPSEIQKYNQSLRVSTKSKNLIDRTGAVTPLNFDVLTSVSRGAKMMLTDFYLTDPIRTSRKTISNTRKVLEERGDVTEQEIEIVNAVDEALELTLDDLLIRTFTQSTWLENAVQYISRTGYRLMLASLGRFGVELFTNSQFVAIFAPKQMKLGLSKANRALSMGNQLLDVMNNLGSTSTSRAYPDQLLSGRMIETSIVGEKSGDKGGRAYNDVRNKMTQIFRVLVNPGRKGIEKVADVLISTPDKAIIRPLWMGSFEYKFEEITKTKPDINKITDNDEAYMEANQEALDAATEYADQMLTFAGAADNPFKGILKGKYPSSVKQSAMLQAFNISNSFMTRFLIYEFISAQIGTYAMMGQGAISRRQGAALLGAVATRMVFYTLLLNVVSQITKSMFGLGDEEEEKDIEKRFGQALASTAVSLIVGRDFGNIVKGLLNYGVENLNEEFLDELRDGDYDPYRDSIAYTFIPPDKEYKSNTIADYIRNLMGSFGPFYKMTEFGVKALSADEKKDPAARVRQLRELNERLPLEVLGNLGLIPFYREIRMILLADIYKGMGKDKKGSSTGMTKAEKAQMKEYFPELYKMQMQMEEDMKNPELEQFKKEMKLLEKQLEESLKQR
jgi:hypothetical protein